MMVTAQVPMMYVKQGGVAFPPDEAMYIYLDGQTFYFFIDDIKLVKRKETVQPGTFYKGNYIVSSFAIDNESTIEEFKEQYNPKQLEDIILKKTPKREDELKEKKDKLEKWKYIFYLINILR